MTRHKNSVDKRELIYKMSDFKRWLIGILISVLVGTGSMFYKFGGLEGRINQNEKNIQKLDDRIETVYTLFDSRLNTIIIGIGDLNVQGTVNSSQLKTMRDDIKTLQFDIKRLSEKGEK